MIVVGQVFRFAGAPALVSTLVDMGWMQTLVHQSLVCPSSLLEAEWVEVKCVHGDVHRYPIVPLLLKFWGKTHTVQAAVSPLTLTKYTPSC